MYHINEIADWVGGELRQHQMDYINIQHISLDSRIVHFPSVTVFFALKGDLHDGHLFVRDIVEKGVKNIVVNRDFLPGELEYEANWIFVSDTLSALQTCAAAHRSRFAGLFCVGITGSNGKTTIKEWLSSLLSKHRTVRSPKSYNSQTGVPLSLWQIEKHHDLGLFEAGISTTGEMEKLEKMIHPDLGIFTNIGDAHAAGFSNMSEKIDEKLKLFVSCESIIYEEDDLLISERIKHFYPDKKHLSWGETGLFLQVQRIVKGDLSTQLFLKKEYELFSFVVPFTDDASIQNIIHCLTLLLYLGYMESEIQEKVSQLHNLAMRLELKSGENGIILINDTYNADIHSFSIALEFLNQHVGDREKVVFLSTFDQTGKNESQFAEAAGNLLLQNGVRYVYGIGDSLHKLKEMFDGKIQIKLFSTTADVITALPSLSLDHKAVLIKGSRRFGLDKLANALSQKWHEAVLETDLMAVGHNLRYFSSLLQEKTGIIAVIKASAYGSGSHELAAFLEYSKVNYLAVAYVDEGIELRKNGIKTPIMVLNSSAEQWEECINWQLEPEVYSLDYIHKLWAVESDRLLKVHIKIDTGMNRLGISVNELTEAVHAIKNWPSNILVESVFTHLTSSEDETDDDFTHEQVISFEKAYKYIVESLGYRPKKHVLNTAGIRRFPEYHFDYVRLGLGLYGIDVTDHFSDVLEKVHTLKARIIQIKTVKKGETVGYNRRGKLHEDGKVAIVNIGYADGFLRLAGNGKYMVKIREKLYPVIGNINMDLTIVAIGQTDEIKVGDEVEIFGKNVAVETLAEACQTIPYEILCRIAPRIKRVYIKG
ncbi:MAG: bifunctional UDP-N-acetylmuramoyl-tripeptide:D-alanyl-D-alanine ligase/alanine racemase [Saprospiraceae bacterium]|nr:bifunctional UDP-N-acetylmuramoyl-tripeptide:D-alanyl-D-alanine ligase/alanine racemase [Saprospiraceae bacterium]